MERVFSLEVLGGSHKSFKLDGQFLSAGPKAGFVYKIVGVGKYVVTMADGRRINAEGSKGLKLGSKVQVLSLVRGFNEKKDPLEIQRSLPKESGLQLKAFLPLGFGGEGASASLRIYVEKKCEGFLVKKPSAIYFILNIETDEQGKLQWSIYLKERQVAIQVFSDLGSGGMDKLKILVANVEKTLKNQGFHFLAPTVYLKRFFRVPEGFHLNIKG